MKKSTIHIKYHVVEADYLANLITKVNELLVKGWELQGGVVACVSESDDYKYTYYYQTVFLKEERMKEYSYVSSQAYADSLEEDVGS
jgi:hypothetical protein